MGEGRGNTTHHDQGEWDGDQNSRIPSWASPLVTVCGQWGIKKQGGVDIVPPTACMVLFALTPLHNSDGWQNKASSEVEKKKGGGKAVNFSRWCDVYDLIFYDIL